MHGATININIKNRHYGGYIVRSPLPPPFQNLTIDQRFSFYSMHPRITNSHYFGKSFRSPFILIFINVISCGHNHELLTPRIV